MSGSATTVDAERRRHLRTELFLSVRLVGHDGWSSDGLTVNVSPGGVLCESAADNGASCAPGSPVQVAFIPDGGTKNGTVTAGRIVRCERTARSHYAVRLEGTPAFLIVPELVGVHDRMLDVKRAIRAVSRTDLNLFILGETGTGKNRAAEAVHRHSARAGKPFVRVNCAALPPPLFEAQLFGAEKGAYTGATSQRPGLLRMADGGTLLLDEISSVPVSLQAKLLRVIEEKRFYPVGGHRVVKADVRIIATSNENIRRLLRQHRLRRDLYYRLAESEIFLPLLRARSCDIAILAEHFLMRCCRKHGVPYRALDARTLEGFLRYDWPGNVRELEHTIKRGVLLGRFSTSALSDQLETEGDGPAPSKRRSGPATAAIPSLLEAKEQIEKRTVLRALEVAAFDPEAAASRLEISVRTLQRKRRKYGLDTSQTGAGPHGKNPRYVGPEPTDHQALGRPAGVGPHSLASEIARAEENVVRQALSATHGNLTQAAALLNVSYRTLLRRLSVVRG